MGKRACWTIILITIAINVVMLYWTIESYYGLEYEHVFTYTIVAIISSVASFITYLRWRKLEYNK